MDLEFLKISPPWDWPAGAAQLLLKTIREREGDVSDRLIAIELAGEPAVIDDALAQAMLEVVQSADEPEELRAKAAISLGPILELADTDGFDDLDDVPIRESTFERIVDSLRKLYVDADVPKLVRRRILEASVRAPRDWHHGAVRASWQSDDADWNLTAIFAMRWIEGFDDEVLEALGRENQDIHYEAVCAAGAWELDRAWSHVADLVRSPKTDKPLLLAAIDAAASIRPDEAPELLETLADSEDDDIAEAIQESLAMAGVFPDDDELWD